MDPTSTYVGGANFVEAFTTERWWVGFGNTMMIVGVASSLQLMLGVAIATLLSQEIKGVNAFKFIIILPMIFMPVATGSIWKSLLYQDYGALNYFIKLLGFSQVAWLTSWPEGIFAFIIADVWQWTPFVVLTVLAGFYAIPSEIKEAAQVEGAQSWQIIWYITLPMIKPILLTVFLFRAIELVKAFDKMFTLTAGGPGYSTETMSLYIYEVGFKYFRLGYAATLSYILLIIVIVLLTPLISLLRKSYY